MVLLLTFFLYSCEATDPGDPPETIPTGYQEDIPWPSLADSPWPMYNHDPQCTGRSNSKSNLAGEIEWVYEQSPGTIFTGCIVGPDSAIISTTNSSIIAFDPLGSIKWKFAFQSYTGEVYTTPLITEDYKIICTNRDTKIFSLDKFGGLVWEYDLQAGIRYESLNIDKGGNIYFVDVNGTLQVINKDGQFLWNYSDKRIYFFPLTQQITFSPDGNILYIPGEGVTILAVNINTQNVIWVYGNISPTNSVMVDSHGNIYLNIDNNLLKLNELICLLPDGTEKWKFSYSQQFINDNIPTIDKEGNIYFGYDSLYSVNYQGELRWKVELPGQSDGAIICDENTNIYVNTRLNGIFYTSIYSSQGQILKLINSGIQGATGSSAAISYTGKYLTPIFRNKIVSIK
jgi:hypothetical protein